MRHSQTLVLAAAAAAVLCQSLVLAQSATSAPAVVAAAQEAARWRGEVALPNGASLGFTVAFTGSGETTKGTMSIPVQGVKDAELKDCRVDEKSMKFTLALPSMPEPSWAHFEATVDESGKATGLLKQGPAQLPLTMTKLAKDEPTEKARPQDPKKPYPYTEREVSYINSADGAKLGGTLTIPDAAKFGKGPFPTVMMITGSGAQNRDEELMGHRPFLVIADHLTRAGIAVLRVDDRGVGASTSPSKGKETTLDFAGDARAGVDFLKTQPEIDAAHIGLIGHSEGGLIAPITAADSKDVAFIVLLAGTGVNGHDILVEQMAALLRASGVSDTQIAPISQSQVKALTAIEKGDEAAAAAAMKELITAQAGLSGQTLPEEQMKAAVDGAMKQFGSPWMKTFLTLDPHESLAKVKCPVLVLNGGLDAQVVAKQNIPEITKALLAAGNQDVTVRIFPNLNHLFQTCKTGAPDEYAAIDETIAPVVLEEMATWIQRTAAKK